MSSRMGNSLRVGMVSTYPPSRCGIARFCASLADALRFQDAGVEVDVARVISGDEGPTPPGRAAMEFDPESAVSRRVAARHLDHCHVVLLQHEFGIYGRDDGAAVLDLVDQLHAPVVAVLHTVLPRPSPNQRRIVERLAAATTLVVPSHTARATLLDTYDVAARHTMAIPHGAYWSPAPPLPAPHRRLITWGLLGPGKGLERALHAVAHLGDVDPPVSYTIAGQTHPKVLRTHGQGYRESLERLAAELGIADRVEFVNRYVDDDELYRMVAGADVVLLPYDNDEQISSGVLTEAVAAGRPVVATRFPHAVELLSDGAGRTVDHDAASLAKELRTLLDDPAAYADAASRAAARSAGLGWPAVAARYLRLLRSRVAGLAEIPA